MQNKLGRTYTILQYVVRNARYLVFILSIILLGSLLFIRLSYAAWSEPTAPPTGNNTNPPLDTSSTSQNKTGALTVGSPTNYTAVGMYAPIYYDANNTSYYLQPSNTSISLQAAGNICASTNCLVTSGLSIENSSSFPAFPGSTVNGDFAIGGIGPADSISFGTQNAAGNGWAERMRFGIGANTGSSYIDVYEPTTFTQLITANNGIKFSDGTIQTSASGAGLWNSSGSNIYNTNSGNVGIGTTVPSGLLTINTSAQTTNLLNIIAHTSGTPTTEFLHATNASGSDVPTVGFDLENSAVNMFEIFGSSGGSSYASRLGINLNNGNVGIGAGNPTDKLTIVGTSYPTTFTGIGSTVGITGSIPTNGFAKLTFGNGAGGDYGGIGLLPTNSGSYLYFGTSNNYASGITNNAMVIDYNGNVGIGTTSPDNAIQVAGLINFQTSIPSNNYLYSTFLGQNAGSNSTGISDTAIGAYSLASNTTGANSIAIGTSSLRTNTTGNENTAIGPYSLYSNTTGYANIAMGYYSLESNTTGYVNLAIGDQVMRNNTTGYYNTAIGADALWENSAGYYNTALGWFDLHQNTTGNSNTAVGYESLYNNTVSFSTALGAYSLYSNTTGGNNTALGAYSLYSNTTSGDNTAIGEQALFDNTGNSNTAVGMDALYSNTTGSEDVALGMSPLQNNTTGNYNIGIGYRALADNQTDSGDVAVGADALSSFTSNSTLYYPNTAVGEDSGWSITTGGANTGVGSNTLYDVTTGSENTFIGASPMWYLPNGANSGDTLVGWDTGFTTSGTQFNSSTAIGQNTLIGASNVIVLGSGQNVGIGNSAPTYRLQVGSSGDGTSAIANAWYTYSDKRFKTNINPIPPTTALQDVLSLQGVTFNWIKDNQPSIGFIAQDVQKIVPQIVSADQQGYLSVDYSKITPILVQAIKEQEKQIQSQQQEINQLNEALKMQ